jgi:DNA-binding XRE family transcriptional regulator
MTAFSLQLRKLRAETGLTQAKAATLLGLDKRTIERIEAGQTVPKPPTQAGIISILKQQTKQTEK